MINFRLFDIMFRFMTVHKTTHKEVQRSEKLTNHIQIIYNYFIFFNKIQIMWGSKFFLICIQMMIRKRNKIFTVLFWI